MKEKRERKPAAKTGFLLNKDLGQHILKNPQIVSSIVEKAHLKPTDIVLEVGPGTGNLTAKIILACKKVIVVEKDPRMAAELIKRFQGTPEQRKLQVIIGDVIKVDLPYFDVCISNTPYQISSPLVFKLLKHPFRSAVLMFQREFALRLLAEPNTEHYSRLSVNAQLQSKVTHVLKVGRNNFRPPPKVESSVVRIEPWIPRPSINYEEFDGLLRILFNRKNKTVAGNFKTKSIISMIETNYKTFCSLQNITPQDINVLIAKSLGEYAEQRTNKMEMNDFLKLLLQFNENGIHFK